MRQVQYVQYPSVGELNSSQPLPARTRGGSCFEEKEGVSDVDAWASAGICGWGDEGKVSGRPRREKEGGEGEEKGQKEGKGGNRMRVQGPRRAGARGRGKIGSIKGSPAGRKRKKGASGGFLISRPRVDSRREAGIGLIPVEPSGFSVTASGLQ